MYCSNFPSFTFSNLVSFFCGPKQTYPESQIRNVPEETFVKISTVLNNDLSLNKNRDSCIEKMIKIYDIINIDGYVNIYNLFALMDMKMVYLRSGTTGHIFKIMNDTDDEKNYFIAKIMPYIKDEAYGKCDIPSRPENVDLIISKLMNELRIEGKTPHITKHFLSFKTNIEKFIKKFKSSVKKTNQNELNNCIERDGKYCMWNCFEKKYYDGEFENDALVLIEEHCESDLLDYIRNNYATMTYKQWRIIIFQLLSTLATIHSKYPTFRHNSLKPNDVLVKKVPVNGHSEVFKYCIDSKNFYIPNIGLQIKINDFDFSSIEGIIENNKVNSEWCKSINISSKENKYYDIHYFFSTLTSERFFPQFNEPNIVPEKIKNFIHRVIPEKYRLGSENVNPKGRILVNDEYTTPYKLIMEDPLFQKYRFDSNTICKI